MSVMVNGERVRKCYVPRSEKFYFSLLHFFYGARHRALREAVLIFHSQALNNKKASSQFTITMVAGFTRGLTHRPIPDSTIAASVPHVHLYHRQWKCHLKIATNPSTTPHPPWLKNASPSRPKTKAPTPTTMKQQSLQSSK